MATNKLTSRACQTAKVGSHFDGKGLYLLVEKSGNKYWRHSTRFQGIRKLIGCGTYPETSLSDARDERKLNEDLIKQGIDPVQYRKDQKLAKKLVLDEEAYERGTTFEKIARRLIQNKEDTKRATPEYCQKMLRSFEIHIFPNFGHREITSLKGGELLTTFVNISKKVIYKNLYTHRLNLRIEW